MMCHFACDTECHNKVPELVDRTSGWDLHSDVTPTSAAARTEAAQMYDLIITGVVSHGKTTSQAP